MVHGRPISSCCQGMWIDDVESGDTLQKDAMVDAHYGRLGGADCISLNFRMERPGYEATNSLANKKSPRGCKS